MGGALEAKRLHFILGSYVYIYLSYYIYIFLTLPASKGGIYATPVCVGLATGTFFSACRCCAHTHAVYASRRTVVCPPTPVAYGRYVHALSVHVMIAGAVLPILMLCDVTTCLTPIAGTSVHVHVHVYLAMTFALCTTLVFPTVVMSITGESHASPTWL